MSSITSPYSRLLDDNKKAFTDSNEIRKAFTRAAFDSYQFGKLKFLASSVLHNARDAKDIAQIYDCLKRLYGGDTAKSASALNTMLTVAGIDSEYHPSEEDSGLQSDVKFLWRVTLVECSDRAVSERKVSKLVDHLYKHYDIRNLERVSR